MFIFVSTIILSYLYPQIHIALHCIGSWTKPLPQVVISCVVPSRPASANKTIMSHQLAFHLHPPPTGNLAKEVNTVGVNKLFLPMQVRVVVKQQSPLVSLDRVECRIRKNSHVPAGAVVSYERTAGFTTNVAKVKKSFS